jgi:hypothetical protein
MKIWLSFGSGLSMGVLAGAFATAFFLLDDVGGKASSSETEPRPESTKIVSPASHSSLAASRPAVASPAKISSAVAVAKSPISASSEPVKVTIEPEIPMAGTLKTVPAEAVSLDVLENQPEVIATVRPEDAPLASTVR